MIMRYPRDPICAANFGAARKRVPFSHNLAIDEVRNENLFVEYGKESKLADKAKVNKRSGVRNDDHDIGLSSRSSSDSS